MLTIESWPSPKMRSETGTSFSAVSTAVRAFRLVWITLSPGAIGLALPRPPVLAIRLSVQDGRAADSDVRLVEDVDERRVVHALVTFEAGRHQRQIVFRVAAEALLWR